MGPPSEAIHPYPEDPQDEPQQTVLIVGADPVRLAQSGITVEVIEKEKQLSEEPRARTYYASALTALHNMGIMPDMKRIGFVSEGTSDALLDVYANERAKAFQMFVDLQSTQHKLRLQSDPETLHENWFIR
ncbi:uncharacterized protein N7511_002495 [Penicillium nucicola]|uniref:uncharacterized protein n=1 Tax=Penicillium nucicola TaxID=1850975 RepID=UPI002544E2D0|nr:uncharacterized protein N7511_002495 [Penicillium nucicola]KAJ5770444.1 hypothetical protein N7511_002495 [Penicillium nucicola]